MVLLGAYFSYSYTEHLYFVPFSVQKKYIYSNLSTLYIYPIYMHNFFTNIANMYALSGFIYL